MATECTYFYTYKVEDDIYTYYDKLKESLVKKIEFNQSLEHIGKTDKTTKLLNFINDLHYFIIDLKILQDKLDYYINCNGCMSEDEYNKLLDDFKIYCYIDTIFCRYNNESELIEILKETVNLWFPKPKINKLIGLKLVSKGVDNLLFTWNNNYKKYKVTFYNNLGNVLIDEELTSNLRYYPNLTCNTNYKIRVSAIDCPSIVQELTESTLILSFSALNLTVTAFSWNSITVAWNSISGVTNYNLNVYDNTNTLIQTIPVTPPTVTQTITGLQYDLDYRIELQVLGACSVNADVTQKTSPLTINVIVTGLGTTTKLGTHLIYRVTDFDLDFIGNNTFTILTSLLINSVESIATIDTITQTYANRPYSGVKNNMTFNVPTTIELIFNPYTVVWNNTLFNCLTIDNTVAPFGWSGQQTFTTTVTTILTNSISTNIPLNATDNDIATLLNIPLTLANTLNSNRVVINSIACPFDTVINHNSYHFRHIGDTGSFTISTNSINHNITDILGGNTFEIRVTNGVLNGNTYNTISSFLSAVNNIYLPSITFEVELMSFGNLQNDAVLAVTYETLGTSIITQTVNTPIQLISQNTLIAFDKNITITSFDGTKYATNVITNIGNDFTNYPLTTAAQINTAIGTLSNFAINIHSINSTNTNYTFNFIYN